MNPGTPNMQHTGKSLNVLKPIFRTHEVLALIEECLDQGWTGMGNKTIDFERKWKDYTGLSNAHFLASNTSGLHLALEIPKRLFNWQADHEVITTPLTFVSTNHAILQTRLTPVFADVDESLCLCPDSVLSRITDKTRALVFVGIGGNISQLPRIIEICRDRHIWLVLDAAHMSGTLDSSGQHVGLGVDVSVFSFQAVKNLPTADSGMICFSDFSHDQKCRQLSWLGISSDTFTRSSANGAYKWDYDVEELGYKYHGNSIMAAIGLAQLKYLDIDNSYRRYIFDQYKRELNNVTGLRLIEHTNCTSSRHLVQCEIDNRNEVIMALNDYGIYPGVHYKDNTLYKIYLKSHGTCPRAHSLSKRIISLPCHLGITREDIAYISTALRNIIARQDFAEF